MEEEKLARKYIKILNEIIQKETLYPNPDNEEHDFNSAMGWEADSRDFNLRGLQFVLFFNTLAKKRILSIETWARMPEYSEKENKVILKRDKEGKVISGDESVVFYKQINLEKAKQYRQELKEVLTPEENNYTTSQPKPKIKLIYLGERGLCLESNRRLCYSPTGNRYRYLKIVIEKNGKSVSAKELGKEDLGRKLKANRHVIISQAITGINKLIQEKLGVEEKLIWGENGYSLNQEDYEIITT